MTTTTTQIRPLSRHRWVVLAVGVGAQASFAAAFTGIPVTGPTLRSEYHLTIGQLGWVLGSIALGIAISEIAWGLLTDRWGDRNVLLTGLSATGAALVLMSLGLVPGPQRIPATGLLVASFLLVGILGGSVNGSSGRAVMKWFGPSERGFAMSIRQTAIPAGGAVGAALLPPLAAHLGFAWVYGVLAAFAIGSALATYLWLRDPAVEPATTTSVEPPVSSRSPLAQWDVWRVAMASFLLTVPQFAVLTFAAIYLHDVRHASLGVVAATLIATQVGGAVARVWSGRYTDRHQNRRQYVRAIGFLAAVAACATALTLERSTLMTASLLALTGMLGSAWHGVAYTEIATMAGVARAGTALGLENTAVFAAAFLTPALIPVILSASTWPAVWLVAAGCSILAVPLSPPSVHGKAATPGSIRTRREHVDS